MKMIRFLMIAMAVAVACTPVASSTAEENAAPRTIRSERELPSRYPYVVEDALKYCEPEHGFWVDLGAGKGQVAIPLIDATGQPVMMLDPDEEAMEEGLAIARDKGLANRLLAIVGVAEAMPLMDNSVDFLVSRGSIFFWDDPAKGLQEVYRVLRPGAKAYIGGGAGSGYPQWATEKLIASRKEKAKAEGEDGERWRRFIALRRPSQMKAWAKRAGLTDYTIMGEGAISAEDDRVGQGVWIIVRKPASNDAPPSDAP